MNRFEDACLVVGRQEGCRAYMEALLAGGMNLEDDNRRLFFLIT